MNFQIYILRFYFKTISLFAPKLSGVKAFKLFQKVRIKTIRKREEEFYINAKHFNIPFDKESLS